ncbi:Apurinic endonuclease-redox protein [Durusdinium trenchii]|uniref:Apurinic endonuclease-redox protein n=1 Tax=Durusdinium trenchii TaxID=1381693 RepID=A0ABP0K6F6_9DINO
MGPQLTLLAAAQASGHPAVVEIVEEAATELMSSQLQLVANGWGEGEENFVQRCLQAGADPSRPMGAHGLRPLQQLCVLRMDGLGASLTRQLVMKRVSSCAQQLAEAAPAVLILAFGDPEPRLPLEAAAQNPDFAEELLPVLSATMGRLLLQRPALMAAPVLQRAVTAALEVLPQDRAVRQLGSLVHGAAYVLDPAVQSSREKKAIWEPYCAFEDWQLRQRRLQILEPLLAQVQSAEVDCERQEAVAQLAELQQLLEASRRQHAAQVAELQSALDKAQRQAEEAAQKAAAAAHAAREVARRSAEGAEKQKEMALQEESQEPGPVDGPLQTEAAETGSARELLRSIRQQRGPQQKIDR